MRNDNQYNNNSLKAFVLNRLAASLSTAIKMTFIVLFFSTLFISCSTKTNTASVKELKEKSLDFYVVSDLGRNGYFKQKDVAKQMGITSETIEPEFIISSGDLFHGNGIRSTNDPMWLTNFESIYTNPGLHCDWYPVLGNHEYHGNTQAVIDYSKISRRWNMPGRYYTVVKEIDDSTSIRLVFIDTAPFVKKYRKDSIGYPDACKQDIQKQLVWVDSVLSVSKEKWNVVIGHHPIFSIDKKHGDTPELIEKLNPILKKYNVDAYISGHIHNFQHLQVPGSKMDYIVNTSGSLGRPAFTSDSTRFSSSDEGFTICSATNKTLGFRFVNYKGKTIYQYKREKK